MGKQYIIFAAVFIVVVVAIVIKLLPGKAEAQEQGLINIASPVKISSFGADGNGQKGTITVLVGKSDIGNVYIDENSVEVLKKGDSYFLMVSVETRYTDANFLNKLHQDEKLQYVTGCSELYLFTSDGKFYAVPNKYLIDDDGKVCADLSGEMTLQPINEEYLNKIYVASLKVMERKK